MGNSTTGLPLPGASQQKSFAMDVNATSFTSPLASLKYGAVNVPQPIEYALEYVVETVSQITGWQLVFTVLGLLVVYDQCQ